MIQHMTVIDDNKNEIQLKLFAECTCGHLAFILKNPTGRKFTRCLFCGKEYLEKMEEIKNVLQA